MILGFKKQFIKPIKSGTKLHSIRAGNRWREGMKIHYYTNVRTKQMKKFRKDGICVSVQDISIRWLNNIAMKSYGAMKISVDGNPLITLEMDLLAFHDGFRMLEDFMKWFDKDFEGQIIHWTNFKY